MTNRSLGGISQFIELRTQIIIASITRQTNTQCDPCGIQVQFCGEDHTTQNAKD